MKKITVLVLGLAMLLACIPTLAETVGNETYTVKTGVSWNDQWGLTIANVIEQDGQVFKVLCDTVRDGVSSKEKFNDYGILAMSSIGKEWWEQVAYYENSVRNNGVDAVEIDENNHALNADVISGATINIADFTTAIKNADEGIVEVGGYVVKTGFSYSEQWGSTVANVVMKDGEIVKVLCDTVRGDGTSSKEKFDAYGVKKVSSIDKEWWEQVAFFETWVENNDLADIAYDDEGHGTNPDIVSGATIRISYYVEAIEDALNR